MSVCVVCTWFRAGVLVTLLWIPGLVLPLALCLCRQDVQKLEEMLKCGPYVMGSDDDSYGCWF